MEDLFCSKCGVGTESYYRYQSIRKDLILCNECCKEFICKGVDTDIVSITELIKFAENKTEE